MRRCLAIGALVLAVAGCGGDGDKSDSRARVTPAKHRAPTPREKHDIEATIAQLEFAIEHGDEYRICDLYTDNARQTEEDVYATCDTAVLSDLRREKPAKLAVGKIDINFDPAERPRTLEASAAVTSSAAGREPFTLDAVLVLEHGAWRIDDNVIDYLSKSEE